MRTHWPWEVVGGSGEKNAHGLLATERVAGRSRRIDRVGLEVGLVPLRPDRVHFLSALPDGFASVEAASFVHPRIRWLGRGAPAALIDVEQAAR